MNILKRLFKFSHSSWSAFVVAVEIILGTTLCFSSIIVFGFFTHKMLETDFNLFDVQVSRYVYSVRTPALTSLMVMVSGLGADVSLVIAIILCIILFMKKHKKESLLLAVALLMGIVLDNAFKLAIHRTRPLISPLVIENSYSFPSGHAMNAFVFYSLLAYFSFHFFHSQKLTLLVSIFSGAIILLVGFSRIYLGVHFPTDVIAGYIAGFWWLVTILLLEYTLIFYKQFKHSE